MPSLADTYYERASGMLARARETNGPVVARLAPLIGQSIARGGVVHTFGSGHSELISREIIGRAACKDASEAARSPGKKAELGI